MRCIFCRMDSAASLSREHIIPESLGNTSLVLPKGVVCDKCNNYFSREVERPFLESPAIRALRFDQGLESKKGRVPSITGLIMPDIPAVVTRFPRRDFTSVAVPPETIEILERSREGTLILPLGGPPPDAQVVSRFMAKVALEAMAKRVIGIEGGQEYICDERQLDPLREHARYNRLSHWPVHARTIYDANAKTSTSGDRSEQIIHESDFLVTSSSEWFFVLAIFGLELTINLGGPEIEGYRHWLRENNEISPLYRPDKPHPYPRPDSAGPR